MMNMVGMANSIDQNGLMQQVGVKMLDKSLEMQEQTSASMAKMLESSVSPHLGKNFDVSVYTVVYEERIL